MYYYEKINDSYINIVFIPYYKNNINIKTNMNSGKLTSCERKSFLLINLNTPHIKLMCLCILNISIIEDEPK